MEPGQNQGNTPDRLLKHSVETTVGARLIGTTTVQPNGNSSSILVSSTIAELLQLDAIDDLPIWVDSSGWIVAYAPPGGGSPDTSNLPNEITVEPNDD